MKNWWQSKTVWTAIIGIIGLWLSYLVDTGVIAPSLETVLLGTLGALSAIFLRQGQGVPIAKKVGPLVVLLLLLAAGCQHYSVTFHEDALQNRGGGRRMPDEPTSEADAVTAAIADAGDGSELGADGSGRDFILIQIFQGGEVAADIAAEVQAQLQDWFSGVKADAPGN